MNFKDAITILGERGITFRINENSAVEFNTVVDGKTVQLAVCDKMGNHMDEFTIDDNDQLVEVVEMFGDADFFVPLKAISLERIITTSCERCEAYEQEIDALERANGMLQDDVQFTKDYAERYRDLSYTLGNCY